MKSKQKFGVQDQKSAKGTKAPAKNAQGMKDAKALAGALNRASKAEQGDDAIMMKKKCGGKVKAMKKGGKVKGC